MVAKLGGQSEVARELAYRLYNICEREKRAREAEKPPVEAQSTYLNGA